MGNLPFVPLNDSSSPLEALPSWYFTYRCKNIFETHIFIQITFPYFAQTCLGIHDMHLRLLDCF